jgi:hypothetical protein
MHVLVNVAVEVVNMVQVRRKEADSVVIGGG